MDYTNSTLALGFLFGGATGTICVAVIFFYVGRSKRGLVKSHICGDDARKTYPGAVCALPKGHADYLHEAHVDGSSIYWIREDDSVVMHVGPI